MHTENSKRINHQGIVYILLKRKFRFFSVKNEHLQELMHGKIILSPIKKIITNAIKQNEIDEELLRKANKSSSHHMNLIILSRI